MAAGLKRSLGLWAVLAISIGAMLGSGIFVLPGLAADKAGPAAALAYFIAGIVILPAAFSKAEMSTAMPEAGGTYIFIDRAMGPLMGTVAGFGVWFSLIFKASFALAGLGAYLSIFNLPGKPIALGLAALLIVLNVSGAKASGSAQTVVVVFVLIGLALFMFRAGFSVEPTNLKPFFSHGKFKVLATAALVFGSYAGVTKVASVAEEVKDPTRNIPKGMVVPLFLMMILYPLITLIMIGVAGEEALGQSETPVAFVAGLVAGNTGRVVMAILAILALVSMANAGLLAASRYPFAMARNGLAPSALSRINPKTAIPTNSTLATGIVMIILIAVFPLTELAKLSSGFQLVVFSILYLAPIAFRQSKVEYYKPTFKAPFYPWLQIFGIVGSLVLLSQLGAVPILGALSIMGGGVIWYRVFGRARASRESALLDAVRMRENERSIEATREAIASGGHKHTLVVARETATPQKAADLVHLGNQLLHPEGHLHFVQLDERHTRHEDLIWDRILPEEKAPVPTSHPHEESRTELALHVREIKADFVIAEMPPHTRGSERFIADVKWLSTHIDADTAFLRYRGIKRALHHIVVFGSGGPVDELKMSIANMLIEPGGMIEIVHALPEDADQAQVDFIDEHQQELLTLCDAWGKSTVVRAENLDEGLKQVPSNSDLVVLGAPFRESARFSLADRLMEQLQVPVLVVHKRTHERASWRRSLLQRIMY